MESAVIKKILYKIFELKLKILNLIPEMLEVAYSLRTKVLKYSKTL